MEDTEPQTLHSISSIIKILNTFVGSIRGRHTTRIYFIVISKTLSGGRNFSLINEEDQLGSKVQLLRLTSFDSIRISGGKIDVIQFLFVKGKKTPSMLVWLEGGCGSRYTNNGTLQNFQQQQFKT